jgi:CHAD domain-containing protein
MKEKTMPAADKKRAGTGRLPTLRFAVKQSEQLLRDVTAKIQRAVEAPDINAVHDLRVAARRLRHLLEVLKPCFPPAETAQMRHALKTIMRRAGEVRDHDIAMQLLTKLVPAEAGSALEHLRQEREECVRLLSASLQRWTDRRPDVSWHRALKSGAANLQNPALCKEPAAAVARHILPAMAEKYFRQGKKAAREGTSMEELHRFRIAAKRFRYSIDSFEPLYGKSLAGLIGQLKETQDLLGDIHDCAAARDLLRKKDGRKVRKALKKRQREKTEEFLKEWAGDFSNPAVLRKWKASFR